MASSDPRNATSATVTIGTLLVGWTWLYNVFVKGHDPITAFFQVIDTLTEDLVMGSVVTVLVGTGILVVFTLTKLYSQVVSRPESFRLLEGLVADLRASGDVRRFTHDLLRFRDVPGGDPVRPGSPGGILASLAAIYAMSWVYLVLFSEALFFVSWSAGVDLPITAENLELLPTLSLAIPFSARVMAYVRYPYAQDYADFMPGAVFVLLLVASLGFLFQSDDQKFFLVQVVQSPDNLRTFLRGGLMLAFIPVFSEALFWLVEIVGERRADDAAPGS